MKKNEWRCRNLWIVTRSPTRNWGIRSSREKEEKLCEEIMAEKYMMHKIFLWNEDVCENNLKCSTLGTLKVHSYFAISACKLYLPTNYISYSHHQGKRQVKERELSHFSILQLFIQLLLRYGLVPLEECDDYQLLWMWQLSWATAPRYLVKHVWMLLWRCF